MKLRIIRAAVLVFLVSTNSGAQLKRDSSEPRGSSTRPPNIIYIMADDLGYGDLGVYGQTKIKTPHLDQLAAEGMRFTRFYSSSTVCAPTRAALMTGRHAGHLAIRGNLERGRWGPREKEGQAPLPAAEFTIAELLKQQGYTTGLFGKWGLGGPGSLGHPLYQGFDQFFGYLCQRIAHGFTPPYLWNNHDVYLLPENGALLPHQKLAARPADDSAFDKYLGPMYSPSLILEQALDFIEKNKDRPFFLYFPSTLPHLALQAPPEWVNRYPKDWDPEPYLGDKGYLPCLRPRATYAAMVSILDHSVGELVSRIEHLGLAQDTLVVFTSDNGATYKLGGFDPEFFHSNSLFRGHKTQLYEGGLRVPFLARWKGTIQAGSLATHRATSHDIFATLSELTGADHPSHDGISFLPTLRDKTIQPEHDVLYFEFPEGTQSQAIICGRYKLIRPDLKNKGTYSELYDLEADPAETTNLAATHPHLVRDLERRMLLARSPSVDFKIPVLDALHITHFESPEDDGRAFFGPPRLESATVFSSGRFPNVVVTRSGVVLVFFDGVRVRRSTDGGKNFGPEIHVGPGVMGGGMLVDETTGDVLAFVEDSMPPHARLMVYRSMDDGLTWLSQTTVIHGNRSGHVPSMHMNERGITLRHGARLGRLIRASRWYAKANYPPENFPEHYTDAIFSDDGGRTWSTSEPFPAMGTGEAAIVELADGRLYYNSRRHWAPKGENARRRWTAWSRDSGETWTDLAVSPVLPDGDQDRDYGLMAGLVRLPIRHRDVLIYSNIDSPSGRKGGTLWVSFDGGLSWPLRRRLSDEPFAYSSLDAGRPQTPSEGWIYLLYETGGAGAKLCRLNLTWILGGEKTGDGEIPAWVAELARPQPR